MLKNHEGYHDPTACKAIRKASGKRKKGIAKRGSILTYRLGEVPGFPHRIRYSNDTKTQ